MPTTWNPSDLSKITLSGGNLVATGSASGVGYVRSTTSKAVGSGQYHAEFTMGAGVSPGSNLAIGIANSTWSFSQSYLGEDGNSLGVFNSSPTKMFFNNGSNFAQAGSYSMTAGDVVALEIDLINQLLWWENVTQGSGWIGSATGGNPATGTSSFPFGSMSGGPYFLIFNDDSGTGANSLTANFGATAFAGAVSSGYSGWDPLASTPVFLAIPNYDGNPVFSTTQVMY